MEKKKNKNADPNDLEKRLIQFIYGGKVEEAKLLAADPDCNVNYACGTFRETILMKASRDGHTNVIKLLLKRQDLLINQQQISGETALTIASDKEKIDCVELLLGDPRTDVNLVNNFGESALWAAYLSSCPRIMKLLILHGADIEGIVESVTKTINENSFLCTPSFEATEVMENWKLCLPEFTRVAKTNKYYPIAFKKWAFNFILCCLKNRSFPKDIIYLLLEYIARAWKRI